MFAKLCAVRANRNNRNKKGFTLAELLIVVAILGVLVAIAIPVFTSSLDKAEANVKAANFRAAKAVAAYDVLINDVTVPAIYSYKVDGNKDITVKKESSGTEGATSTTEGIVIIKDTDVT